MKRIQRILWMLAVLQLFFCVGCKKTAVLYDGSNIGETDLEDAIQETDIPEAVDEAETAAVSYVYVCGEVANPGVYELPAESRIGEAVEAAGGLTGKASTTWLNLAERMTDGQKIEVPSEERARILLEESVQRESSLINLNTATAEQLMTLRGIGESKAEDILNYREQHGGFGSIEELMQISGIKERVFEKIKDQITV